ncbi:MAG: YibE/F family protein [Clostridia bacterium]|nr:YibE/F family protein [Clostridia bacterium]
MKLHISADRRKKRILMLVLLVLAVIGYVLVDQDASLYHTTIVKITSIETQHTETQQAVVSGEENYYVQSITGQILNGERKGATVSLSNQYTDSNVRDERYRVGDSLLVELGKDGTSGKILEQKRDTLVYLLAAALLLGMIAVADLSGLLAICSLMVNIVLLTIALYCYLDGWNIMALTAVMILLFSVLSLLIGNGWNRCSMLAIVVTLLSLAATAGIYLVVRAVTPALQYQMLEYAVVPDDLSSLFFCEIMIGGLGAVMDVAISLISTADELLEQNPHISYAELKQSIHAVSDDIMGTMVNVLFFTYICGGLPEMLLMLRNNLTISFVWEYVLSFELVRFLVGSIGLVLAVPVSQLVLRVWMKRQEAANG